MHGRLAGVQRSANFALPVQRSLAGNKLLKYNAKRLAVAHKYISVIVVAYNRRKYILQAVRSALQQTLPKDLYEVIVVKNFRDEIIDRKLEEWKVANIHSEQSSQGGKIYEGIRAAEGEVISILDDDDEFLPNRLSVLYRAFSQGACYFHNGKIIIDEMGKEIGRDSYISFTIHDYNDFQKYLRIFQKKAFFHNTSSAAIRKSIINIAILKKIKLSADSFLFLSAIEQSYLVKGGCHIIFDGAALTKYRVHAPGSFEGEIARLAKAIQMYVDDESLMLKHAEGALRQLIIYMLIRDKLSLRAIPRMLLQSDPPYLSPRELSHWLGFMPVWYRSINLWGVTIAQVLPDTLKLKALQLKYKREKSSTLK